MAPDRFWSKAKPLPSGCWVWQAAVNRQGYGRFRYRGRTRLAHRHAYEWLNGPIPDGLTIDHLCCNPSCVNPAHMEAVTMRENILRGSCPPAVNARKTHCLRGHPLVPSKRRPGRRYCPVCRRHRHPEQT